MNALGPPCPHCSQPRGDRVACASCRRLTLPDGRAVPLAGRWRRFFGFLLEQILILVLFVVGWLLWLWFSARASQTPAKRLLGMYVVTPAEMTAPAGRVVPASTGRIWFGEVAIKFLLLSVVSGGILLLVDGLWILFSRDRQTLHDKIAGTLVVHSPEPVHPELVEGPERVEGRAQRPRASPDDVRARLESLRERRDNGRLGPPEYEDARRRILDDI